MSVRVDPSFLPTLKRFGAFDISGCFNCGNCTAVCPYSQGTDTFPRRMVRYAQLGMKERLAASKEVWLCYYCGECSETCPRQADPGEFMASARRYFISQWDLTGLARRLYTSTPFTFALMALLAVVFVGIFLASGGRANPDKLDLLGFIDLEWLHYAGILVLALAGLAALANMANFLKNFIENLPPLPKGKEGMLRDAWEALKGTVLELAAQRKFVDCHSQMTEGEPWYLSRRWIHLSIMWGFLGLWGATTLDLLFKEPGSYVPLWYPPRLLGTLAGLALLYGTTAALLHRLSRTGGSAFARSLLSDWLLLGLLWAVALSGFILEIAVYLPADSPPWGYAAFLMHIVLALELLILIPFSKFAHAVYRPVAILIHEFWGRRLGRGGEAG